ncbi:hypothetical protein [Marixanthomonas spongiae]|uniref:Uncharacterized protein n=1 Tax=Marixanthomonas spongiae TaxID=2174845 RepID=A0A2U0I7W8_9FLAO|nr:hypothetical protein [Marixanthomonas spongiae]PVW17150.1 hypothetical protein DDV96_01125 [Marixanthomonas spongiae]
MKKYISTLLLLCLLLPSAGTYLWLSLHKITLKKELKHNLIAGIDKEELVLLKFSKAEIDEKLRWEHSKEFEYKGQMYDVVETKKTIDSISYWCWWDYEETKLNRKLNKILLGVLDDDSQTKEQHKRLTKFYRSLFFNERPTIHFYTSEIENIQEIGFFYSIDYQSISLPPPDMPPRIG